MNALTKAAPARPIDVLRKQLVSLPEIAQNLPSTVSPDRFRNVVVTAANMSPDLLEADRRSLLGACVKCAADGLVPDGREAALVIFNQKSKDGGWEKRVQYMPMLAGILKRARNSGEIAGISVQVVYERDEFTFSPDDFDRPIRHTLPALTEERGKPVGAYALVKLKDGTVMAEAMGKAEIDRVRGVSKAKDAGPWVQWWDQMARKTVLRRLSKYLPMDAAPLEAVLRRDDELGAPQGDADAGPPVLDGEAAALLHFGRLAALEAAIDGQAVEVGNATPEQLAELDSDPFPPEFPSGRR
jgi:recombination protein RecT